MAVKREMDRVMASKGLIEEDAPEFAANESVKYAGVLLALLRIKNPEQIKTSNVGDLGIVLGLDRCPEVKTIRRKLNELGLQNKSLQFMENLSRAWIEQDEKIPGFVYIDDHVRPYHGRKHTLPKTHVARRRLCMPATTDFWVNGTDCEPLFFVTAPANDSLLSMIDNEIIPGLKQMSGDRRAILVFDREGWSPRQFSKWHKVGIDTVTYRKGRYEPWPEDCFVEAASQVRGRTVTYKLSERSILLKKMDGSGKSEGCVITDTRPLSSQPARICPWKRSPGGCFCAGTRKTISNTCGKNMVLIILYPGMLNRQISSRIMMKISWW